jgi:hypothetical protein
MIDEGVELRNLDVEVSLEMEDDKDKIEEWEEDSNYDSLRKVKVVRMVEKYYMEKKSILMNELLNMMYQN